MKLDLTKETEYRGIEAFNHLVTVLMIMFSGVDDGDENETEKEWDRRLKIRNKIYKDAKDYLASYIEALIEQKICQKKK